MKPAIVVIAYNRPRNLANLLASLARANYDINAVSLVISIDYNDSPEHAEVVSVARNFVWDFGDKTVIQHKKNLGIRDHILSCGDLTDAHDAVIVLEDDIRVSPDFYFYARHAAIHYHGEKRIAGISLYAYEYDELGWFQFYPNHIGGDTYFMQWAASWGQLWTRQQWASFKSWYYPEKELATINMPDNVKRWNHSWKKYYIAYLVEQNLFFAYPYRSYTTLRDEKGAHNPYDSRTNNVFLAEHKLKRPFLFSDLDCDELKYDSFFQPVRRSVYVPTLNRAVDIEFDLFGTKRLDHIKTAYLCSIKYCKNPLFEYSNKLIPYEANITQAEEGSYFYLAKKADFQERMSFFHEGSKLYHARKIYQMKQMLTVFLSRIVSKYLQRK